MVEALSGIRLQPHDWLRILPRQAHLDFLMYKIMIKIKAPEIWDNGYTTTVTEQYSLLIFA
jgi:hypothetical protein